MKPKCDDDPDMEPEPEKQTETLLKQWGNFNMDSELINSIVSMLTFLILTILLWIYKEKY